VHEYELLEHVPDPDAVRLVGADSPAKGSLDGAEYTTDGRLALADFVYAVEGVLSPVSMLVAVTTALPDAAMESVHDELSSALPAPSATTIVAFPLKLSEGDAQDAVDKMSSGGMGNGSS
jgi:hypothetical protein